jgi:hypothetical protein
MSVLPYFASEKLLSGFDGQPPFKGCGLSADWAATALATDNESAFVKGRPKGKAHRTADLKRGWRAFTRVADSNGIPDTGDMGRIHAAMFPGLPQPTAFNTRDFAEVIERLDRDFAISIALRLSALPASSPLRKYTSADHQVTLYGRRGPDTRRIDPMHDHSDKYIGEMVPLAHVKTAARAIEGGLILTWLYPIGGWTEAALRTERLRREIRDAGILVRALESRVENKQREVVDLRAEVAILKERLDGRDDCDDEIKEAIAELREKVNVVFDEAA